MHVLLVCNGLPFEASGARSTLRKLILLELTAEQRSAVDAPYDECFAILGAAATGKSTALAQRIARARELHPGADPLVFGAAGSVGECAAALLRSRGMQVTLVDDVDAELIFAQACAPLFALDWEEFATSQLDPEVPGLRSPERFLQSAFRLIRRLRDADVEPAFLLSRALAGATEFYANPPNLADPGLLFATKHSYHDSLAASREELLRQYRRELDLAKILTRLYQRYVELVRTSGRMTERDAVIAACRCIREDRELSAALRDRHRFAFVDDAQELTKAQVAFLHAIFGERLPGVTLCGDPASGLSGDRMTQPDVTFSLAQSKVELHEPHRSPLRELQRLSTPHDEALAIAERVGAWLQQGCRAESIAVLFRSVRNVTTYESALLDRDIPVIVAGDFNVFADRRALDAVALLWNVYDPFRHEWLLRTLANHACGLSDRSIALLCGEPPDPQRPLFAFDEEPAPTVRSSRWNPKRDLRLGWNVLRGERDEALSPDAAARIQRFRARRERWVAMMDEAPFETFVRTVWHEGLAREGDSRSARARAQQVVLRRLFDRLNAFREQNAHATVVDVLQYAEQRMGSDLETCTALPDDTQGFVQLLNLEAARGREFDHVVVAGVQPGSFPRWYSAESFLFSPRLGMIPKENVGDARSSRTAKFTYYIFRSKAPQQYYERERRAFAYALRRARKSALVTASGGPTRATTAPEFLEELRGS